MKNRRLTPPQLDLPFTKPEKDDEPTPHAAPVPEPAEPASLSYYLDEPDPQVGEGPRCRCGCPATAHDEARPHRCLRCRRCQGWEKRR